MHSCPIVFGYQGKYAIRQKWAYFSDVLLTRTLEGGRFCPTLMFFADIKLIARFLRAFTVCKEATPSPKVLGRCPQRILHKYKGNS